MNVNNIKCLCGNEFNKSEFKNHFRNCKIFFNRFKHMDMRISLLLNKYLAEKENIILVKYLFKRYIKLIENKINLDNLSEIHKNNKNYFFKDKVTLNEIKKRLSTTIDNIISNNKKNYITYKPRCSLQIIKNSFIYENLLKSISNNNIKDINKNKINFVKKIIEDQKNFYSSFPAPINSIDNGNIKNGIQKCIAYKRHSIFIPISNETQLQIEKSFYLNWRVIGNVNSDTGYLIVKRFRSLLENEINRLDNIKMKLDDSYNDDKAFIKSKKKIN